MGENPPKVEFVLGSEVSPGHFFKSTFARSFVSASCRDSKSLDYEFLDNGTIAEEPRSPTVGPQDAPAAPVAANHNFYSLVNFSAADQPSATSPWSAGQGTRAERSGEAPATELEKLRKQCQTLTEENERLQASLRNQPAHVQVIDNVYLQNQVDTLQWQLKQSEANREMYRSLMEQVVRFLERARKSLDIIHEKSTSKRVNGQNNNTGSVKDKSRVPRSRSVHTVHGDLGGSPSRRATASSCASSTTSSSSSTSSTSSSCSRFSRAKSVAQIAPSGGASAGIKDLTWSVLRRNDPVHCTPPRSKPPPPPVSASVQDVSRPLESLAYRRPKQSELDPDDVPPDKLAQEAFRLMRTVQSLLVMREPDLARLSATQEAGISMPVVDGPPQHQAQHEVSTLSLQSNFANSTTLQEATHGGCSSSDRGTEGSGSCCTDDETNRTVFGTGDPIKGAAGARQSLDAASLNSASSKTTEEEEVMARPSQQDTRQAGSCMPAPTSTPHQRRLRKIDRKELHFKSLRDWALGNSAGSVTSRPKPATSVSSAEDESGFSSMSSFQEVGLPHVANLSPIKGGCHTEVGLPEVPLDKVRHRRWSSTPAEFHALFKRHSGSFASGGQTAAESLSVWV